MSLQAVTVYLICTEVFIPSRISPSDYHSPAATISRLETWSDSASEETYVSFIPHSEDFSSLIGLTFPFSISTVHQSSGSIQILPSKIYAQDPQRSVSQLLLSSTRSTHKIPSGVSPSFYYPQQGLRTRSPAKYLPTFMLSSSINISTQN